MTRKEIQNSAPRQVERFQAVASDEIIRNRGVERFSTPSMPNTKHRTTETQRKFSRGIERFTGSMETLDPGGSLSESLHSNVLRRERIQNHPRLPEDNELSHFAGDQTESSESDGDQFAESNEGVIDELEFEEKILLDLRVQDKPRQAILPTTNSEEEIIKPRPYQIEMFEESLKRNVIVCQSTGSGKTLIAILRIRHELERGPSDKMCWFLVPTQILGAQQFSELKNALPQVPTRFISGADGTDKWDKATWVSILGLGKNRGKEDFVRVLVCTHQIALDVLTHGFMKMDDLSLLVFDEAHYCKRFHPAHLIMKNFYHPRLEQDLYVPAILGLTASPTFSGGLQDLKTIEENLDATCRSPSLYRSDLEKHVKLPVIQELSYGKDAIAQFRNASVASLEAVRARMSIQDDPYVKSLPKHSEQRRQIVESQNTYCQTQMKSFVSRSQRALEQFGDWAADFYVNTVKQRFTKAVLDQSDELVGWQDEEKLYLVELLRSVPTITRRDDELGQRGTITCKVEMFIARLLSEYEENAKKGSAAFSGLVFVEQRVDATLLCEIISKHSKTRDIFRCGVVMGASHPAANQKAMYELIDARTSIATLGEFRDGLKNLIIATSVAEEGLDIRDCHLVVCFDLPKTIKSFIQMRGRARKRDSRYLLLFPNEGLGKSRISTYKALEEAMIEAYQDENRRLSEQDEEEEDEEDEEDENGRFPIRTTGALLTYTSAIPHVYHFCAVVAAGDVDPKPEFRCVQDTHGFTAELTLPAFVPPEIRQHFSVYKWKSQKMAKRDAAYHAYIKLYQEGLVDDNLMPIFQTDPDLEMEEIKKKTSKEEVHSLMDPWDIQWKREGNNILAFMANVQLLWPTSERTEMIIYLPFHLPKLHKFTLWWTPHNSLDVIFGGHTKQVTMTKEQFIHAQKVTDKFLRSIYGHLMAAETKTLPYIFVPRTENDISSDTINALDAYGQLGDGVLKLGIVRNLAESGKQYIFKRWVRNQSLSKEDLEKRYWGKQIQDGQPLLEASPLNKRRNFYHKGTTSTKYHEEQEQHILDHENRKYLLPQFCKFDCLPWSISKVALLIPSIIRRMEVYAIAKRLQDTVILPVQMKNIDLILEAICATSAREDVHYQRLEILGDSVLKLLAGVQIAAEYPKWPEGYLSAKKDRSVANSKLATESIRLGMSRFIITDTFTPKWRPRYIDTRSEKAPEFQKRSLSSKTVADVVESLIGAAFLEGGYEMAAKMAEVFGLDINWQPMGSRINTLYERALSEDGLSFPPYLKTLERMIGYEFNRKSLLVEAITHPGYNADTKAVSYQRLEFLGDSVLDMIAVEKIFHHEYYYSHVDIHRYKSSAVTADFLAFQCLRLETTITEAENAEVDPSGKARVIEKDRRIRFDKYLRHHSQDIAKVQATTYKKYLELKEEINHRLYHGKNFPWTKLAALEADKFFSDMVESILGAVFVDSKGNWDILRNVTRRFGILQVLERSLDDRVDVVQPVSKLGIHAAKKLRVVKYEFGVESNKYWCAVKVNGEEIAREGNGTKKEEVRMRVAEKAYEILAERDAQEVFKVEENNEGKEMVRESVSNENDRKRGTPDDAPQLSRKELKKAKARVV